jgi:hypothetical protein
MTNIEKIVTTVKRATDYQINKRILKEKIEIDLHFAYAGGLFRAGPELIVFASLWTDSPLYIEDTYQNPVEIADPKEFETVAREHYQKVMNRWHQQHEELKRIRKV